VTTTWEWRGAPVWWIRTRSLAMLVGLAVGVWLSQPHPNWTGPGRWTALGLAFVAIGWVPWVRPSQAWWLRPGLVLAGAGGLLLCWTNPASPALAYPAIVCLHAGARTTPRWAISLAAGLVAALVGGVWLGHRDPSWYALGPGVLITGLLAGLFRRQNAQLQAQAQRAQAHESALAERARIAREIHDVLAHALAALTVQLETADALLESGRAEQARISVVRAGQLAREGLAEARRAIGALRGEALPVPELLDLLVAGYRADLGAPAMLTVEGPPVELAPDTGLALYRTAQEAVTNIRKHAPGAPVDVRLSFRPGAAELTVHNGQSTAPAGVDGTGGGYGLAGLRERAELAGGEFVAGPDGDGWRVSVRIPT
jgi:signal transduction histidine kinase